MSANYSMLVDRQSYLNMALIPIRKTYQGEAPISPKIELDIIDEAINYFKNKAFFRKYLIKSDSDRVLLYLTIYISECLERLRKCTNKTQGQQEMYKLAISKFDIPGDPEFPLNTLRNKSYSPQETDLLRQYFQQLRHETAYRVCEEVFATGDRKASKWWLCFKNRKFVDKPGPFIYMKDLYAI